MALHVTFFLNLLLIWPLLLIKSCINWITVFFQQNHKKYNHRVYMLLWNKMKFTHKIQGVDKRFGRKYVDISARSLLNRKWWELFICSVSILSFDKQKYIIEWRTPEQAVNIFRDQCEIFQRMWDSSCRKIHF